MTISLPLDPTACAQADDVFYCKYRACNPAETDLGGAVACPCTDPPLFDAAGNRVPLTAEDPRQESLRRDWCAIYEAALQHNTDGSVPFPSCGVAGHDHHDPACPFCEETPEEDDPGEDEDDGDDEEEDDDDTEAPVEDPVGGCPGEDEEEDEEEPTVTMRISMFFDGTGNNRWNAEDVGDYYRGGGRDSFSAGESNVSKLERCCRDTNDHPGYDHYASWYTEGIGTASSAGVSVTTDDDGDLSIEEGDPTQREDDTQGFAWGSGPLGVKAKVEAGIENLVSIVKSLAPAHPVRVLHVDAVGFSRGAAAARRFVWRITYSAPLVDRLKAEGIDILDGCEFKVMFVGLFDTVASYVEPSGTSPGSWVPDPEDHEDDTAELMLHKIYDAQTVVQLAAAEEHRECFQLTTISAGREFYLPGVHSDIGGGYTSTGDEVEMQIFDVDLAQLRPTDLFPPSRPLEVIADAVARDRAWWIDRGWYTESEMDEPDYANQVHVTRRGITNYYSRIPLQIMAKESEPSGLTFKDSLGRDEFTIHSLPAGPDEATLKAAESNILASIRAGGCGSATAWMNSTAQWHKDLRHRHLHNSARYKTWDPSASWSPDVGHNPDWSPGGSLYGVRVRHTNWG